MTDILDQQEVDALLNGVASGDIETETDIPVPERDDLIYDLTNPEKIVRGKMPALAVIHDRFVKQFQTSLSTLLRRDVDLSILSFDVMKYLRFIETIPLPTSLCIVALEQSQGVMLIEMDSTFVFTCMDILCGGTGSTRFKVEGRDFTPIEQRMIEKIATIAAEDLNMSWHPVVPLQLCLEKTEINPRFVSAVEKTETLVVFSIEVMIEQVTCTMKICIPYSTVEPYRMQLSGEMQSDKVRAQDSRVKAWLEAGLQRLEVDVAVEIGEGEMTFRDLMNLQVGDIIELDTNTDDPFSILCEGVTKFKAIPGQHKSHMAVQIVSPNEKRGR
jgi:flagellar motor switch protein FliM